MAANTNPVFPLTPVMGFATLVSPTALTSRAAITGTTGLTEIAFADTTYADGRRIDKIRVRAKETTVAGMVFIWIYDGTTVRLFHEFKVEAQTPSTTTPAWEASKDFTEVVLPSGFKLYCSVSVDQDFDVFAFGGNY